MVVGGGGGPEPLDDTKTASTTSGGVYTPFGQQRSQQSFNVQSSVFSVNANGRAAVTADSQGLCVLGMHRSPFPVHRILHQSRWAVSALECCRHVAFPERVASSSRHNILIWDVSAETAPLLQVGLPRRFPHDAVYID